MFSLARQPILVLAMLAVACAEPPTAEPTPIEDIPNPREVADDAYVTTESGLKYYDFKEGTGNPVKAGDNVSVHYHGWLASGMFIDSSYLRQEAFTFTVGAGAVIDGWDEGVVGMRTDGERQLVVPPDLGYGETGRDPVPPNATMIFEITVVRIF